MIHVLNKECSVRDTNPLWSQSWRKIFKGIIFENHLSWDWKPKEKFSISSFDLIWRLETWSQSWRLGIPMQCHSYKPNFCAKKLYSNKVYRVSRVHTGHTGSYDTGLMSVWPPEAESIKGRTHRIRILLNRCLLCIDTHYVLK